MTTRLVLVRHGETEWSRARRHTSWTDLSLTPDGQLAARDLTARLSSWTFSAVLCSPRRRARETAALALPNHPLTITADLAEWNYGRYEGITTADIHSQHDPQWDLWSQGAPGGESPQDVAARADRVIETTRQYPGDVACFAHGHILRVLAARWLGLGPEAGRLLALDTASVSVLGFEHQRPVLRMWNITAAIAP